jgi:hypothetical protein
MEGGVLASVGSGAVPPPCLGSGALQLRDCLETGGGRT